MNVRIGSQRARLVDADLLGAGGEARVFRFRDRAVKIYHPGDDAQLARKLEKIRAFPPSLPPEVVAPLELCTDQKGKEIGFTMRRVDGAEDVLRLSQRSFREGTVGNAQVTALFARLHEVLVALHGARVVVGDLNDSNVLFTGAQPWLIDADSMQFGRYLCTVGHERFLDPRLYGVDLAAAPAFSEDTDWYAFAVMLFGSLLYVHPYGGLHKRLPTLLRRAEARHSLLRADVQVPRAAVHFRILPDELLGCFEQIFDHSSRGRFPAPLLDRLRWTRCACGLEHARPVCPDCASLGVVAARAALRHHGRCTAREILHTRGRILCATVQGNLKFLVEEEGAIRREDGTLALYGTLPARARVAIAGATNFVAVDRQLLRLRDGQVVERTATGLYGGQPMFDAGSGGCHRTDGEWLIEGATGARIGQILDGQTWFRTGEQLGFGFYRAGLLTVHFLFRRGRAGLTQVALPPIDGRLIEAEAIFDEHHVLFLTAVEKDGRRTHAMTLVDETGRVRARISGAPDSQRMLQSVHGKALANGRLLCMTDEGLLSIAVDDAAGLFGEGRLFADTQPFVTLGAQLLCGPQGSIYVVTPKDIVQLTLS